MLRLLFTNVEQDRQLTVITDGIDGQLNVFVTENVVGDTEFYKGIGIDIDPGITYNIEKLKEWALANSLKLVGYPEEFEDDPIIFVDNAERWEYKLNLQTVSLDYLATGGSKDFVVTSSKQKYVNNKPTGGEEAVEIDVHIIGNGYSWAKGSSTVSVNENPTDRERNGDAIITQKESGKQVTVLLTQAPSVIDYEYSISTNPASLSFEGVAESKDIIVTSVKQKKLNGKNVGNPTPEDFIISLVGDAFYYELKNDRCIISVHENITSSERKGTFTATQLVEGGEEVSVELTQAAAVETWEYNLSCEDSNIEFPKEGGMKILPIQSSKQKFVNGKKSGSPIVVAYTTTVSGAGFSKGQAEYSVIAEANAGAAREGSAVVKSSEGNKTITITLSQAAGTTV